MASIENSACLLGLPVEIRSLIYREILEDMIRPPPHPWDPLPKPKDYLSLLLVNREIHREASELFGKLYAKQLVLYFDDILHLHWIWANRKRWPELRDARFWSQAFHDDVDDDNDCKQYGALLLIDGQTGWDVAWNTRPGFFRTQCIEHESDWIPEAYGFKRTTISHPRCDAQGLQCVPFTKLEFPTLPNGCKVTTYRWCFEETFDPRMVIENDYSPDGGCMVLEGRIDALTFEDVPVETVRCRMEQWAQRKSEGNEESEEDEDK